MRVAFFIFLFFVLVVPGYSENYIDSLETKLILVDNAKKLEILDEIIPYYFRNDPDKANSKSMKMLSLSRQEDNLVFEIKAQRYIALTHSYLKSDFEEALNKSYEVEKQSVANGLTEELILTKMSIAEIFDQLGNYQKSLSYFLDAFHLADSVNFVHLRPIIQNGIARCYLKLNDFEDAQLTLRKALRNAKLQNQQLIVAESNMIYGDLFFGSFNMELALENYQLAYNIFVLQKKRLLSAEALFKIGNCYFNLEQNDISFQYHLDALAIRRDIRDRTGLAESFNRIGLICIENGEYQRAINNLKLGLYNAESVNSNIAMQQSFDYLYQTYLAMDDFENAVIYKNKYVDISDLIYSEASERRIQEINNENEIQLREEQIKNLEEETMMKERQLSASRKFIITLTLLLLVVVISAFFIIRSYREKKRINLELEERNQQIMEQNRLLVEVNSTKDKFFSIIGHDLKGPLNSLTSFSELLMNHTASLSEEEIRKIARELDTSLKNLFELLDNLLGWARSQTSKLEIKPELFNLSDMVKECIMLLRKAAADKKLKIELIVDKDLEVFADPNSIKTVMRNLLSNSIKFTEYGGVISVFADEWKDSVDIGVHDTGVGMTEEVQQSIFDISAKHTTLGTNQEKGTGLGLILCKEFVEKNEGSISVESKVGKGTTFKIILPKQKLTEEVAI